MPSLPKLPHKGHTSKDGSFYFPYGYYMATKRYSQYRQKFSQFGYAFRLNKMNDVIECNDSRLSDALAMTIESKMFDAGFHSAAGVRRSYTRLAYENQYHPIIEWLDSLVWDGQDHFGALMSYITFQHQGISEKFIWRFLLGCVGKVRKNTQNSMSTWDGKQGIGKSELAKWLIPRSIRKYFVEGGLDPDHKDTKLRVISNFLWEVGELQGITKKADLEALKNIITQERVTARPAYGRYDIDKPIICSFIGTVNESGAGFLNDVTGNRRFAVVKMLDIDWGYVKLDPEKIWAQVATAYEAGERGVFTSHEKQEQAIINEDYNTLSHVEQYLLRYYDIDLDKYKNNWIPINEILERLENNGLSRSNQRINLMELAGILTALGCGKSRKNPVTHAGRAVCYSGLYENSRVKTQNPYNP